MFNVFCANVYFHCNIIPPPTHTQAQSLDLHESTRVDLTDQLSTIVPSASSIFFTAIVLMWPPWQSCVCKKWTICWWFHHHHLLPLPLLQIQIPAAGLKTAREEEKLEKDILVVVLMSWSDHLYADGIHFLNNSSYTSWYNNETITVIMSVFISLGAFR